MSFKRKSTHFLFLSFLCLLGSCGKLHSQNKLHALKISETLLQNNEPPPGTGCSLASTSFWDALYQSIKETQSLPILPEEMQQTLSPSSKRLYSIIFNEINFLSTQNDKIKRLTEMQLGDQTTPEKMYTQIKIEESLKVVFKKRDFLIQQNCSPENPKLPISSLHPALLGMYKTMSVGYQSCNAIQLPLLNRSLPNIEGVLVTGTHPSGSGLVRTITDSKKVFQTNPYYSKRISPLVSCFPNSAASESFPLIYDFGGKPFASSDRELNLFQNEGSGSNALGIDCSGFVSSGILVGGLRLKKNTPNRAYFTSGVNSQMFSDPQKNGLTCLKPIENNAQMIQPGDLLAFDGHVIMIDQVSDDPFSIKRFKSIQECIPQNINEKSFQFSIIQSSPVFGGLGMNRMPASEYFREDGSMKNALIQYGISYCKAIFGTKEVFPKWSATLVRHTGESGCMESPIDLKYENCLKQCPAL